MSVSATSDYRYRGYSLSAEKPALLATASYDAPTGLFASASAIAVASAHSGGLAGYQAYAGYAQRYHDDDSWEVGVSATDVDLPYRPRYRVRYQELYVGLSTRRISAHVYYSPDYLGEGSATIYATTTAAISPRPDWKLFAEAGALLPVHVKPGSEIRSNAFDMSLGAARSFGRVELQAIASTSATHDELIGAAHQSRNAISLSATVSF